MEKASKKRSFPISVAMATYNGEKYIKEQLDSILINLLPQDEIVISDDGSTDKTIKVIKEYKDNRIKVIKGPGLGYIKNFENCFKHCHGKYIFISDQDDIWEPKKVDLVLKAFDTNKSTVVVHDAYIVDEAGCLRENKSLLEHKLLIKSGIISNIIQGKYYGCLMAFDQSILGKVIPIPDKIDHDMWIGLISDKYGKTTIIKEKLIKYRRHNNNNSSFGKHMGMMNMIKKRLKLINSIIIR